jgi:hypothetical protein
MIQIFFFFSIQHTVQKRQSVRLVPHMQRESILLCDGHYKYCIVFGGFLRVTYVCIAGICTYNMLEYYLRY